MFEFIQRKKRKHNCQVHFNSNSFYLNGCMLTPVHVIPEEILPSQEFDFYMKTRYDIYLLRLTDSDEKRGFICPAHKGGLVYIICFVPVNRSNISFTIKNVMHSLEQYGFPKIPNPQHELSFTIQC